MSARIASRSPSRSGAIVVRCCCGFEAVLPEADSLNQGDTPLTGPADAVLYRKPGGGYCCPECLSVPPNLRAAHQSVWEKYDALGRKLPKLVVAPR